MKSVLMDAFQLGSLRLRNRIVMLPMGTNYADGRGFVTQRMIDYYTERARGGVGLIITETSCVAFGGRKMLNHLSAYDDACIPGLQILAKAIKEAGSYCFAQIDHCGRRAYARMNDGLQPVSSSAIPSWNGEVPRELSLAEIEELIEAYSNAAKRVKEAGFDGVEVHCGHGHLVDQFFSPLTNKRTDKYGGSLEDRARFGVEIVQRIRRKVGGDYPISALCGDEFLIGGLTPTEIRRIAKMLERAGVTVFNVSGNGGASSEEGHINARMTGSSPAMGLPPRQYVPLAKGIKEAVKVPVIATGRLDDFDLANQVITEGKADLIGIGRGLLADPLLPIKWANRHFEDIRRCVACNACLITMHSEPIPNLKCMVNAELGREKEYRKRPTTRIKRVLVVGGGPGGMEAARVASLRGHDVTLMERKPCLGGNLLAASAAWFTKDIRFVLDYLLTQINKQGVRVLLNTEADEQSILKQKPDVVILATGASPLKPEIAGIERENVTDAVEVLEEKAEVGRRAVVVGGDMVGCETAAFLSEKGKEVILVESRDTDFTLKGGLAADMGPAFRKWFLFQLWPNLPIEVIGKSTLYAVTASGVIVLDREGKQRLVEADTVVLALGMRPNNELKARLEGKIPEIYAVGDCLEPREIMDAIHEASRVARLV